MLNFHYLEQLGNIVLLFWHHSWCLSPFCIQWVVALQIEKCLVPSAWKMTNPLIKKNCMAKCSEKCGARDQWYDRTGLHISLIQYRILLIRKHVWRTVPKSGVMGGAISCGKVRQNMEKFPAMATKVVRVSL
jgi:hypothetical protein